MKIYVAGASCTLERARKMVEAISALGHQITHDWVRAMAAEPRRKDYNEARQIAHLDLSAVRAADVLVWLLPPEGRSPGAWAELGGAAILNKPIIASGVPKDFDWTRLIFAACATWVFETDEATLEFLAKGFPG